MCKIDSKIFSANFNRSSALKILALAALSISPVSAHACDPLTEVCIQATPGATGTSTPSETSTPFFDPSETPTALPSATAIFTRTPSFTRIPDATSTTRPTATIPSEETATPVSTQTSTATPTVLAEETKTSLPTLTATVSPTPTKTKTAIVTKTSTPIPTRTATLTPTSVNNSSNEETKNIYVPAKCSPLEVYPFVYALDTSVSEYYGRIVSKRFNRVRTTLLRASSVINKKSLRRILDQGEKQFSFQLSRAKRSLNTVDPVLVMCPDPAPTRCIKDKNQISNFRDAIIKVDSIVKDNFAKILSKRANAKALAPLFKESFTTKNIPKISERAAKNLIIYSERIPSESWKCRK